MTARRDLTILLLVVLGAILFVKNSGLSRKSKDDEFPKQDDPTENTDFVSDAEIDLTAAAIIEDLDQEAREVLPEDLSPDIDSLSLSEQEKMELEALLSPASPLGLIGAPVLHTNIRDNYEDRAPGIERVRSLSEKALVLSTKEMNAEKIAEERKSGKIKELQKESVELEKKIEFAEEKKRSAEEEASVEKRDLDAVYVEERKTMESVQELERFKKESRDNQEIAELEVELEGELKEQVAIVASHVTKKADEKAREHAEAQKQRRDQIFENEKRKEREIDLAKDPETRQRLQRELVSEKNSAMIDLRDLVKEQASEEKELVRQSSNVVRRAKDQILEKVESKKSEIRKLKSREQKELDKKHEESRKEAAKNHTKKVDEVEKFSGTLVKELVSVTKKHESTKEKVEKKVRDVKKRTPRAEHPRKSKSRNSVKTTSIPSPNGSVEFTLEVPSDLTPGQVDSVEISVSKEENNSIQEYRTIVEKIKKEGTLKYLTQDQKAVIAEAGRVFENVKQKYVKKRGEKVSRRASVIRETRKKNKESLTKV